MHTRVRVAANTVPEPPQGTFSNCLVVGDTIYLSGQLGTRRPDGDAGGGSVLEQATQAFTKIQALLEAAGATMADIVKLTVFLTDITKRAEFSEARRAFFAGDFPCSTLIGISALAEPGLLIEIEAIAVRNSAATHL